MKKFTSFFAIALIVLLGNRAQAQCSANYNYSVLPGGTVYFWSTSAPTNSTTQYYWNFGNGTTFTATGTNSAQVTYTSNGAYNVNLFFMTVPSCSNSITYSIVVNTATSSCNLNANFNTFQQTNGVINFTNSTSGTVAGTTYTLDYGDGSTSSTVSGPHTYSANGVYTVTLLADNNGTATCTSSKTKVLVVTSYCNLGSSFTYTQGSNGQVNFSSTSTGTVYPGVFWENWNFGDGGTGGGSNPSHTYVNGTYTVSLTLSYTTTPNCPVTSTQVVVVNSNTCNTTASFAYTVGSGGTVNFASTSAGTGTNTTYYWNFGDGFTSSSQNPTHTYSSAGNFNVYLAVNNGGGCGDSTSQMVNVSTAPCIANSNFSLSPTGTPQNWYAIPSFPWNVQNAVWNWGDGASTPTLFPASHQYSVQGTYTICLTVTITCGASSQTCNSYFINKGGESMQMINVTVQLPGTVTDISNLTGENIHSAIFPNPGNGTFQLDLNGLNEGTVKLSVYNTVGQIVYETSATSNNGELSKTLNLNSLSSGVYFLKVNSGSASHTKKIVIK